MPMYIGKTANTLDRVKGDVLTVGGGGGTTVYTITNDSSYSGHASYIGPLHGVYGDTIVIKGGTGTSIRKESGGSITKTTINAIAYVYSFVMPDENVIVRIGSMPPT